MKEGTRLHCPVAMISRCPTVPTTVEGITFPVGTIFTINILNLHHNRLVWPDPWTFRPDRFHPDNMKDKDSYAFIPFSAGSRYTRLHFFFFSQCRTTRYACKSLLSETV